MSRPLELIRPGADSVRPNAVVGSFATPFVEGARFECEYGLSLAEIVEELFAQGLVDRAWGDQLCVFIGDQEWPKSTWAFVRPRPGRIVGVRARAELEQIGTFLINLAINIAIAAAVNYVVSSFVGSETSQPLSFEPIADIEGSRNEIARFRKMNAVLGKFRMFPPHAAKHYTLPRGEKVVLRMLLSWGVAPVTLTDLKIGDTPIAGFQGVTVQHKLKQGDPYPTLFPKSVDEVEGFGVMEFADGWQQRTTSTADADSLEVEVVFTKGLIFYSGDGGTKPYGVQLRIRYREEGSSTWLDFDTGAAATEGHLYSLSGYKKRKPFRMSFSRAVTRGRYEIAVKRNEADDPGPKGMNEFAWTWLRSFTNDPPVTDDNIAITAIEIEVGDQLNGVVDLINGLPTRVAPKWDAVEEEFGAPGETSNPAELVRWMATGPGAPDPRDPVTEIDNDAFGAWAELCTLRGWKCDMELRAGGGFDEVMETVARCGRGNLVERAGKLSVIIDDVQPASGQLFTARNSWGFRSQRRYPRETHALRCQFNNEEKDYVPDEMFVYYPGYDANSAELIETVPMTGKTSPDEVYKSGLRRIAEDLLRPEDYSWRCDIESLTVQRGVRISIAHPVIAVGRRSAKVAAHTLNGGGTHVVSITLDEVITQTPGDTYGLRWRKEAAGVLSVETIALTNMGVTGKVVTPAAVGGLPIASAPKVGDLVTFGDANIETLDVVVQNAPRSSDFEGEVMAVPYTAGLWDGDSATLPPWNSNVSGEAFPRPPAPVILAANSDATGMFVAYEFPIDLASRVDSVEAYWRQDIDSEASYEHVTTIPGNLRVAAYPPGETGVNYKLKLVAVGRAGQRTIRTPSEEITVLSTSFGHGLTGYLTNESHTVPTAADGSGGDYSTAGGTFKLFRGDVDISNGADPDIDTVYSVVAGSVTSGLSIAINADTGVYTITNLTVDHGEATLRATNGAGSVDRAYSISKAKASQSIRLTATSQQFTFGPENNANPDAQTITLSVSRQNIASGAVSWSASPSVTLTGTGDSRTLSVANFGANTAVEVTATLGAFSDKITIVRTRAGGNLFTTVRSANVSLTGRALKKESGSGAYDSQAYSVESYRGGAFASARPNQTNAQLAFGLDGSPSGAATRDAIDFCWEMNASGQLRIYESGVLAWDNSGSPESYTTSTTLSIVYDGVFVRYFKDGVLKRAVMQEDAQLQLFFDSSFFTVNGQLNDVAFGPAGGSVTKQVKLYTRSIAPPATPTGAAPAGWTAQPPSGTDALWSSTAIFSGADELLSTWSTPLLETRPNHRGAYVGGTTYYRYDSVSFSGGTYELQVANDNSHAPSGTAEDNAYWRVIAAPGSPGEPGDPPSGFTATIDVPASTGAVNLRTLADAAGYTGLSDATITFEVESGINVTGLPVGGIGIDSGTWPTASYAIALTLTVKSGGIVRGGGGEGGEGGVTGPSGKLGQPGGGGGQPNGPGGPGGEGWATTGANGTSGTTSAAGTPGGGTYGNAGGSVTGSPAGGAGGHAIYCRAPMTVNINSGAEVKGGGGGGALGAGGYCVRKNGNLVTVNNSGTTAGTIG